MKRIIKIKNVVKIKGIQPKLHAIAEGLDNILSFHTHGNSAIIDTLQYRNLEIGNVTDKEAEFLDSLHNSNVTPKVCGGQYVVLDENRKEVVTTYHLNDLPEETQVLIINGVYKTIRKYYGLKIEV